MGGICNTIEDNFSEQYYLKVVPENLRSYLSKFRCTSHRLEIETGRYQNIARQNRLCKLCNCNYVEDERHFLLVCPLYIVARVRYIPRYAIDNPSVNNFYRLFRTRDRETLISIAKFIKIAFEIRNSAALDVGQVTAPPVW